MELFWHERLLYLNVYTTDCPAKLAKWVGGYFNTLLRVAVALQKKNKLLFSISLSNSPIPMRPTAKKMGVCATPPEI
jgi:hypothetical protein